jgi:translin
MPSLKNVLKEVKNELKEKDQVREKAQNAMRRTTSLSKQAILLIHQKETQEAHKLIEKAREIIAELRKNSEKYPEIIYGGMLSAALQEYSEANIFLKLVEESKFTAPREIGVTSVDYVLGLADVIGEYRRLALDALREGDVEKSEECLRTMDETYVELTALDEAYMLVSGLRRKCDVARKIIEITRGDVTEEIRRNALGKRLERFEKSLKKKNTKR